MLYNISKIIHVSGPLTQTFHMHVFTEGGSSLRYIVVYIFLALRLSVECKCSILPYVLFYLAVTMPDAIFLRRWLDASLGLLSETWKSFLWLWLVTWESLDFLYAWVRTYILQHRQTAMWVRSADHTLIRRQNRNVPRTWYECFAGMVCFAGIRVAMILK